MAHGSAAPPGSHRPRRRRIILGTATAGAAALVLGVGANLAFAATTLFSDTFESGAGNWSKSGGTWAVVSDGSNVLQQSNAGSENAREFAGDTGWTGVSLDVRV